jgi:hypothetical protein
MIHNPAVLTQATFNISVIGNFRIGERKEVRTNDRANHL